MTTKVAIFAWHTVGATFLDWSLHWLTGATKFYNSKEGWITLTSNPLGSQDSNVNAHNHAKNYPRGNAELINEFEQAKAISSDELISYFLHPMPIDVAIDIINSPDTRIDLLYRESYEVQALDLAECQQTCYDNDINVVVLSWPDPIYNQAPRFIGPRLMTTKEAYTNIDQYYEDYFNLFAAENYPKWKEEVGNNIWDRREFYALNMRPYIIYTVDKHLDYTKPNTFIDARELFFNGEATVINLLVSLGLEVDVSRLDHWRDIYTQWQKKQFELCRFSWNLDRICECIVKGYYYDLSTYHLEFWQEAIIQHLMIYKYGLNFKSWQLEKFPTNTQELYKLLEPNIHHIVDDVYGTLKDKK